MSLVIHRARTLGSNQLLDIHVEDDAITKVGRGSLPKTDTEIDASGNLVLPTFIEPHVHLDKALLAEKGIEAETIVQAREKVRRAKQSFTIRDIKRRAERCLNWALSAGVTAIRTHVDVDNIVDLKSVRAMLELKREYRSVLDLQIVAFPQEGVVKEPGVYELLVKAAEMGAGVLGGLPEIEKTAEDRKKQIDLLFELAKHANVDLDLHCDVRPFTKTVHYYAGKVIRDGFRGRATADHIIALSYYKDDYARKVIQLLKMAAMNVIVNPCTMMTSGSQDSPPKGRGVTRIKELVRAGLNVSYGLDNILDPYNPFGDFDPLRNGWLFAYQGFLNLRSDAERVVRMPTYNAAKILRLKNYGLKEGCIADFNILNISSPGEALRTRAFPRYVVKRGRVIAENRFESSKKF